VIVVGLALVVILLAALAAAALYVGSAWDREDK
jgi:hypothetical protein